MGRIREEDKPRESRKQTEGRRVERRGNWARAIHGARDVMSLVLRAAPESMNTTSKTKDVLYVA